MKHNRCVRLRLRDLRGEVSLMHDLRRELQLFWLCWNLLNPKEYVLAVMINIFTLINPGEF